MTRRTTIGLLIDQLTSGYARLLIAGASEESRSRDANLVVFPGRVLGSLDGHEYQDNVIFDYVRPGTVDALIMATGTQGSFLSVEELSRFADRFRGVPLVSTGVRVPGAACVLTNNRTGVTETIEHLAVVHRLRRVAIMNGPELNVESATRFEAYRDAVRACGLDDDPDLWLRGDFLRAKAVQSLSEYLDRHGSPDFQAIFAASDEMAIGCIDVLRERGVAVPSQVAVTGYDNITDSQFAVPSITTVDQDLHEIGRRAAVLALDLARGGTWQQEIVLPTTFVPRTSCGCLPRAVTALDRLPRRPGRRRLAPLDAAGIAVRCMEGLPAWLLSGPRADELRAVLGRLAGQAGSEEFLRTFQGTLDRWLAAGDDMAPWQRIITLLQAELIQAAWTRSELARLQASFQKALALLSDMLRREQGRRVAELKGHVAQLRRVMERLISVPSLGELMGGIAEELYRLDIRTCLVACYPQEVRHVRGEEWHIPAQAEIALAYRDGARVLPAEEERFFSPAESFLPQQFLPVDRPFTLVAAPTFFREDQIGYVVFEPGRQDSSIYEAFSVQLGNILKGSLLSTARSRMIEALAAEREKIVRMAALVESSGHAIFGVDMRGLVTSWNSGAEVVFGYPAQEIVGLPLSSLMAAEVSRAVAAAWDTVREGRAVAPFEAAARRKNGAMVPVSFALSAIRDPHGVVVGTAVVARELTLEKAVQARFIQAQRLESLGMLAGGIAHQFNNINMVIRGYLETMMETAGLPPAAVNYGREALKGVGRLVTITQRLQGLTAGGRRGEETCDPAGLVRTIVPLFEKRTEETGTTIHLDLGKTPVVRMDSGRAGFVLTSLLDNAMDSLLDRPERRITVRTGTAADRAWIEVTDTGCGISRDDMQKLFSPFFTTKGEWAPPHSSQARARGVGLSLSVCRSTVSESGGRIEVESEPGTGSTFRVWLPAVDAAPAPGGGPGTVPGGGPGTAPDAAPDAGPGAVPGTAPSTRPA